MFTKTVLIRANNERLRNELKLLGYELSETLTKTYYDCILCHKGFAYGCDYPCDLRKKAIDCKKNEELFLAIAALRNDSDKYQWFICKEEFISTHTLDFVKKSTWQKSIHDKLTYGQKLLWKKANVKELMLYFNHLK